MKNSPPPAGNVNGPGSGLTLQTGQGCGLARTLFLGDFLPGDGTTVSFGWLQASSSSGREMSKGAHHRAVPGKAESMMLLRLRDCQRMAGKAGRKPAHGRHARAANESGRATRERLPIVRRLVEVGKALAAHLRAGGQEPPSARAAFVATRQRQLTATTRRPSSHPNLPGSSRSGVALDDPAPPPTAQPT